MEKSYFKTFLAALVSGTKLDELYAMVRSTTNWRHRALSAVILLGTMTALLFSYLLAYSFDTPSTRYFAEKNPRMTVISNFAYTMTNDEYQSDDGSVFAKNAQYANLFVRIKVTAPTIPDMVQPYILYLPQFDFRTAILTMPGQEPKRFLRGEPLRLLLMKDDLGPKETELRFNIELWSDAGAALKRKGRETVFITDQRGYDDYLAYKLKADNRTSRHVGTIARVVLAIFALMLYLVIDSSPESKGLALFTGFEAFGLMFGNSGLKHLWLPDYNYDFIQYFAYAMSDIFRLYFFLQIARVTSIKTRWWIIIGGIYSLMYAGVRYYDGINHIAWVRHTWAWRDMIIAAVGMMLCARVAFHLRGRGLPWRVAALLVASVAASAQLLHGLAQLWPDLTGMAFYSAVASSLHANSAYLFALSAFFNISTLENRVVQLSEERVEAATMEKELELGHAVQTAFMAMPKLPAAVRMACHSEAAAYISGDIYYVNNDEKSDTVTFLLNDITGHGVQAAMKAFSCCILARSLWEDPVQLADRRSRFDRRRDYNRLIVYDRLVEKLISQSKNGTEIPINAMLGAEYHVKTGKILVYRANYNFPLTIRQEIGENGKFGWQVKQLSVANRKLTEIDVAPGSFVCFISDGYVESSRAQLDYMQFMNASLRTAGNDVDAELVKELTRQWSDRRTNYAFRDDRTIVVFERVAEKAHEIAA